MIDVINSCSRLLFSLRNFICFCVCLIFIGISVTLSAEELQWKMFGNLKEARHLFHAVTINPHQALVIGGFIKTITELRSPQNAISTRSCEIIDIQQRTVLPAATMNIAHGGGVALRTKDSNVVIIGGLDTNGLVTSVCELYDRKKSTWKILGKLQIARWQHMAVFLNNEEILIVAGRIDKTAISEAEIFNIRTGKSRLIRDFPYKCSQGIAFLSRNAAPGKALVIGGRSGGPGSFRSPSAYEYDANTDQWQERAHYINAATGRAMQLFDGRLVIAGGTNRDRTVSSQIGIENLEGFTLAGSLVQERDWPESVQWNNQIILISAGTSEHSILKQTEWFDLSSGFSTEGPSLHSERMFSCFVGFHHYNSTENLKKTTLLAISGINDQRQHLTSIEILETENPELLKIPSSEISAHRFKQMLSSPIFLLSLSVFALGLTVALLYLIFQVILIKRGLYTTTTDNEQ